MVTNTHLSTSKSVQEVKIRAIVSTIEMFEKFKEGDDELKVNTLSV